MLHRDATRGVAENHCELIEITKGRLPVGGEVVSGVEPFFEKTLKRQRATRILTNNTRQEKHISTTHRIDVHQHVVPPFWAEALPNHGGDPSGPRSGDPSGTVLPQWSPNSAIDLMDSQEIETGLLSLTAPGIVGWDQGERREMARRVNEYAADLVAKQPARFGNLATLPLPDVDGALSELEYALDALGRFSLATMAKNISGM